MREACLGYIQTKFGLCELTSAVLILIGYDDLIGYVRKGHCRPEEFEKYG